MKMKFRNISFSCVIPPTEPLRTYSTDLQSCIERNYVLVDLDLPRNVSAREATLLGLHICNDVIDFI